jgi:hypothetical protein
MQEEPPRQLARTVVLVEPLIMTDAQKEECRQFLEEFHARHLQEKAASDLREQFSLKAVRLREMNFEATIRPPKVNKGRTFQAPAPGSVREKCGFKHDKRIKRYLKGKP